MKPMTGAAVTWAPNALLVLEEVAPPPLVWLGASVVTVVKPTVVSKVVEDSETVLTMAEVETRSVEKIVLSLLTVVTAEPLSLTVEMKVVVEMAEIMVVGAPDSDSLGEADSDPLGEADSEGVGPGVAAPVPVLRVAAALLQ